MAAFEPALPLLRLTALTVIGRRLPWPLPITYVVGATAASRSPTRRHAPEQQLLDHEEAMLEGKSNGDGNER